MVDLQYLVAPMQYKSQLLTQASGSVGGLTFSHNAAGLVCRARSIPVNVRSTAQSGVRAPFGALAVLWQSLTPAQKAAWREYAANVPLTGKMGDPIYVSGLNMFLRGNTPRLYCQGGSHLVLDGPTTFSLGATPLLDTPTYVVSVDGVLTFTANCNVSDAPVGATGTDMIDVFCTGPKSPGRDFIGGSYIFADDMVVVASGQQPNALSIVCPGYFEPDGGQKVAIQVEVSRTDGRLSARATLYGTTTAAV